MSDAEVGRQMGGVFPKPGGMRIGGAHTGPMAKAGLKMDTTQLRNFNNELAKTESVFKKIATHVTATAKAWAGMGKGGNTAQNGMPLAPGTTPGQGTRDQDAGGVYSKGQMKAFAAFGAMNAVAGMVGSLDNRIDRGANYALTADRYNIMMQQQYGLSQGQVMSQMRRPLANYRMGPDGINAMMGFQQQTGYKATQQLTNSLAGIRAITGYSKTGQDVVNDQMAMMDPTVANRMLYMTGANAYTFGGGLNDPMKMRQQIVRSMGLTNASILKGAKGPGSITRARMADAGISEEMQTEILSYAESNLQFQKKGGKGMYDPSKEADRKRMGIEGNFATQAEETDRIRQQREENFASRQLDNMAAMEKNTQAMVKLLGGIEDKLSGIIGARTGARGWMKLGGSILQAVGGLSAFLPGVGTGVSLGAMALGTAMQGGIGDGVDETGKTTGTGANTKTGSGADVMVPYGYKGKRVPLSQLKSMEQFKNLNPKLQDRLIQMFRANPNVGIGGGGRTTEQQRTMFLQRYRKTDKKTDIFWEGSYWEHVSGAAAAPPGRSMHEIGLAADLVGDMDWIKANASKFGLRSFFDVNNEPWHVQPSELPGSRRAYEKAGAAWGTDGKADNATGTDNAVNKLMNPDSNESSKGFAPGGGLLRNLEGMSMADIVAMMEADTGALLGQGGPGALTKQTSATSIGDTPMATAPAGNETGAALAARLAYDAGFRGEDLYKMVAIAGRESGWNPSNKNPNTSDRGMWQINWSANGETMMKELGVKGPEGMFDPVMNAKGARLLWQRGGWRPWKASAVGQDHIKGTKDDNGWDGDGNEMYNTEKFQTAARAAASAVEKSGDPYPGGGVPAKPGSAMVTHAPTFHITVAPNISFMGTPQSMDLKRIANELTGMIEANVRTLEMRNA